MRRDEINLKDIKVSRLFRIYFFPTLLGMLALCAVTATDGIFIGQGVGADGLAAVNICYAPAMAIVGIGLMLGMGASVVASIHFAKNRIKAARINVTQALGAGTLIALLFLVVTLAWPSRTALLLGSSIGLLPLVLDYMPFIYLSLLFQIWGAIGLFVIRLDGSPKYAMWCNILPGILNIVLDYIFIFPLGMGVKGAAIATCLSCFIGGLMVILYLMSYARHLRLIKIKASLKSIRLSIRNLTYQCKIGVSALLGETTMGLLMLMGNLIFMKYTGEPGVGAFSIACYYCPFVFMIGNAIAQSAQPIISYNYGINCDKRVSDTERLAIISSILSGIIVTALFCFFPDFLVGLFIRNDSPASDIAIHGFPYFSVAFIFFIFNLTVIGYFQSIEKVAPAVIFALLRGFIFLIPAFLILPETFGIKGIWLSVAASESLTSLCIVVYYAAHKSVLKHS